MGFFTGILVAALVLAIILVGRSIVIIKQAETMVVERLGRFDRILSSGVNFVVPIIELPRTIEWRYVKTDVTGKNYVRKETITRIDLRETVYDFPRQNVITRDNVAIEINALLYFQITDPKCAVYEIANLPDAIEKLTQTTLRNVVGELDLDHTLSSRDTINGKLRVILDEATEKWGLKVNRVEIQDIIPPEDVKVAMEKQMRAERDRRAKILEAEGDKASKILESEGIREAEMQKAEGFKQASILRAQGEAASRLTVAEAEAKAIEVITKSVATSKMDPATYLIALKYVEAMKEIASGKDNKIVYMPYEATALMGSIGSIKEALVGGVVKG